MLARFTSLLLAFAASASVALAKPLYLADRDAVSPPITSPTAQTVWRAGETQTVTWDVTALDGAPPSNPLAKIILGTLTPDGDEHLMFDNPLVSNVPILGGNASLTVPSVPTGDNYIVCLFGSSGDISPMFTIIGTDASSSSSASASSSPSLSGFTSPASALPPSAAASSTAQHNPISSTQVSVHATTTLAAPSTASPSATAPAASSSSGFTGSVSGANAAAGNVTAASDSSPSQTAAGTSGAVRGALAHSHLWSVCGALMFAFALF
ncbi:hypothetical protein BD414DRAFT_494423 [Trametes punicea]|nr:hypothetical protein BD414DRAFT_494423 [Trametes punicea]